MIIQVVKKINLSNPKTNLNKVQTDIAIRQLLPLA